MEANEKILGFLKECGVFFYATVDGDKPRVRPFGMALELNEKLYIGMGTQKDSYKQTVANPNIEICSCKGGDWMRVRAVAVEDKTPETYTAVMEANPGVKKMYEEAGNTLGIFYLTEIEAEKLDMRGGYERII